MEKLKITISLVLLALFCSISVFSIDTVTRQENSGCECEQISKIKDVNLDFEFKDANIRDILNYISSKTGLTFVVDQSVKELPTTIHIKKISWKEALDGILKINNLSLIVKCPILRVAGVEEVKEYEGCEFSVEIIEGEDYYTKFIKIDESNLTAYDFLTQSGIYKLVEKENGGLDIVIDKPSKFQKLLPKLLPSVTSIKTDERGKYLIVSGSKNQLKLFEKFIDTLKKVKIKKRRMCALRAGVVEALKKSKEESKIVTEYIQTQNIFSIRRFEVENESKSRKNWAEKQEKLARIILNDLNAEIRMLNLGIEVTTTKRRMRFVKNIIALFDKQILVEEE